MYEITIWVKDKITGKERQVTKEFDSAGAMAYWYETQSKTSIDKQINSLNRENGKKK
jgi:hypothetical protein